MTHPALEHRQHLASVRRARKAIFRAKQAVHHEFRQKYGRRVEDNLDMDPAAEDWYNERMTEVMGPILKLLGEKIDGQA